jgi:hypothetical protein
MTLPEWWKEGTVVKVVCATRCNLDLEYEGKIDILGLVDMVHNTASSNQWREFITLNDTKRPGSRKRHPNGWWWVSVEGVEPVEAVDVQEG